jgi:hypothetical protein
MPLDREWGATLAKGTVGIRSPITRFVLERKLSQDASAPARHLSVDYGCSR